MKALNIQIGWIKVAVHASVDVIQSENTNLTLFVMQALGDDARVKHHVVRPQLDRCKGVVGYSTCQVMQKKINIFVIHNLQVCICRQEKHMKKDFF